MEVYSSINIYTHIKTCRLPLPAMYQSVCAFRMQTIDPCPHDIIVTPVWGRILHTAPIDMLFPLNFALQIYQMVQDKDVLLLESSTSSVSELTEFHYFTKVVTIWRDYYLLLVNFSDETLGGTNPGLNFLKRKKEG